MIEHDNNKYGILITKDIKLHRKYFEEMTKLLGIKVVYRAPRLDKHYTTYTEIDSNFEKAEVIGCIFDEHPEQQTLKKMGWASELQENASIIHVPYDLKGLQQGAIFLIPSGIDHARGRVFRVTKLKTGIIYPASITCEIVPEYEDNFTNAQYNYKHSSFNLLNEEEDE